MGEMTPIEIPCPACGEAVTLPARLVVGYDDEAHLLVELGPSRAHANERQHPEILPAALAKFGVPW